MAHRTSTKPLQTLRNWAADMTSFHRGWRDSFTLFRSRSYCRRMVCLGWPLMHLFSGRHSYNVFGSRSSGMGRVWPMSVYQLRIRRSLNNCWPVRLRTSMLVTFSCHDMIKILLRYMPSGAKTSFSCWTFNLSALASTEKDGYHIAIKEFCSLEF